MGHRSGVGAQVNHETHVEVVGEVHHRVGECPPLVIWFDASEEQDVSPIAVGAGPQLDVRPAQTDDPAVLEVHHRSSSPVVEQGVGVKGRHRDEFAVGHEVFHGRRCGVPGVDPALEADDQYGVGQFRGGHEFVHDAHSLAAAAWAASARSCTVSPNPENSWLLRSPIAPPE